MKYNKLYKEINGKNVGVIKEKDKEVILYMMHSHPLAGHFGIEATYDKIKKRYYWKNMKDDVRRYIKSCDKCQRRGNLGEKDELYPIKIMGPWKKIGMDFVGPLERTRKGNKYILVITDYMTKWPEAKALPEATKERVTEFLYKEIICRHGCPEEIISDRGSHFDNELVTELCRKFEIKHRKASPYHPQTNGMTERFNRTLCESLAKISEKENQWDEHIQEALFAYRTNKHGTTEQTPFYLMYGREALLPTDKEISTGKEDYETNMMNRRFQILKLEENQVKTMELIKNKQEKMKLRHDKKIRKIVKFEVGQKVLLKDAAKDKQWSGKLRKKWKGPYEINKCLGNGAYILKDSEGKILKNSYNIKNLKKYHEWD